MNFGLRVKLMKNGLRWLEKVAATGVEIERYKKRDLIVDK